jgi:hypothetical protein
MRAVALNAFERDPRDKKSRFAVQWLFIYAVVGGVLFAYGQETVRQQVVAFLVVVVAAAFGIVNCWIKYPERLARATVDLYSKPPIRNVRAAVAPD